MTLGTNNPRTFVYIVCPCVAVNNFVHPILERLYGKNLIQSIYPPHDRAVRTVKNQLDWMNGRHVTSSKADLMSKSYKR